MDYYFPDYISAAEDELKEYIPDIRTAIGDWYDGYSWDGKNYVYNPFSLLNFFLKQKALCLKSMK
ncbi:MAG: AAA family ATPase [Bacteroidetes bacterium]|nr:AAA family ATPase [Bacteroidota bacterium]